MVTDLCRRFFGSNSNAKEAPKKQATLAFSDKSKKADKSGEAEHEVKTEGSPPGTDDAEDTTLKREKSEDAESDVQPATKRRRRSRGTEKPKEDTSAKRESPKEPRKKSKGKDKEHSPPVMVEKASGETTPEEEPEKDEPLSASENEQPEAKETIEKVQATLKGTGNEPYPDWKPGEPVPYAALCTTFSLIEMTSKRLAILAHCSLFLQQVLRLTPGDLLPTVQLMINKLAADYAGIELGIGESLIMKAVGESTGRSLSVIKADQREIGDLGLVAAKSRSNQPTMFKPKPLTVKAVHEGLLGIAKVQGHGAQDKKVSGIKKLLSAADTAIAGKGTKGVDVTKDKGGPSESKYIVRFLEGKLRLGLAEKTVLVALAQAVVAHEAAVKGEKAPSTEKLSEGEAVLKGVYSELPAYEVIIPAMLEHGILKLPEVCKLHPGVPIKPMLAKPTKSITEVLDRFEGREFTCEYKYDGERAQIHYVAPDSIHQYPDATNTLQKDAKGLSSIFSRNSEDLSKKYPDVLAKVDNWVKDGVKSFVLDCETVAWDTENKKVLPFQQLMTRKKKDVKAEDVKVKVCIFAFDLLFLNGEVSNPTGCSQPGVFC
jgi:DNA ligase-1